MILFFGPPGSGKSVQGKMLADSRGWKWVSVGQLLRESNDPEILKTINSGKLVDYRKSSQIVADAMKRYKDLDHVILDGYPREIEQARWLVENTPLHEKNIALIIILDVEHDELLKRLDIRARNDDEPEAIKKRLEVFVRDTMPIVDYYKSVGVPAVHIDGSGTMDQVHDRINGALRGRIT